MEKKLKCEILIIIPAYNEENNIKSVIDEIKRDINYVDILVINDNSTDNTVDVLKNCNVDFLSLPFNLGYSGVLQCGFKYALEKNYEYVVQFDGDGQHIAKEVNKLYDAIIKYNADIVIGSRFKTITEYKHSFFRKVGTSVFKVLIKKACRVEITDPTSGFQILNKKVYERYSKMSNYPDYPDANLIIEMLFAGYKIEEVYVEMRERLYGTSMHSGILKPVKYMVKMFYSILLIMIRHTGEKSNNASVQGGNDLNVS